MFFVLTLGAMGASDAGVAFTLRRRGVAATLLLPNGRASVKAKAKTRVADSAWPPGFCSTNQRGIFKLHVWITLFRPITSC
ncbi:MAG TPA: hypothetical protein VFY06_02425 [Verrucomicrobiae bacterium]|nr:hypothetical protein [Verrucomicrobiae bacterium]